MDNRRNTISFRIRKIDTDLAEAIKGMDKELLANLCRDGLRVMLGLGTTRSEQVIEKPINVPQIAAQPQRQTIGNQQPPKGLLSIHNPKS